MRIETKDKQNIRALDELIKKPVPGVEILRLYDYKNGTVVFRATVETGLDLARYIPRPQAATFYLGG